MEAHLREATDGWSATDADGLPLRVSSVSRATSMIEGWLRENPGAPVVLHLLDGPVEVYTGAEDDPQLDHPYR